VKTLISLAALTLALTACSAAQRQSATPSSHTTGAAAAAASPALPAPAGSQPLAPATGPAPAAASDATCTSSRAGSGPASTRIVSASVSDDTLTLTFDGGVPTFEATPQPNTRFVLSPIGQTIVLPGSSGVMIRFTTLQMGAYVNLPKTLAGGGPLLLQVRNLEDFEGTVSFGAGLSAGGCASADVSGSTVTFHFLQTGKG